jgi:hypothetical protein
VKKLGFLCTYKTRDLFHLHASSWATEWGQPSAWKTFTLLHLEGPTSISQSCTNSINLILLFFMSHTVCSPTHSL